MSIECVRCGGVDRHREECDLEGLVAGSPDTEYPKAPEGKRWTTCRECNGAALVGRDGTACVCARYGKRPGWMLVPIFVSKLGSEKP